MNIYVFVSLCVCVCVCVCVWVLCSVSLSWVKLLKSQNKENQAGVQGLMRPRGGAGEKRSPPPPPSPPPRPKTDFSFFTANLGALLARVRQQCKQQQVSQRCQKRLHPKDPMWQQLPVKKNKQKTKNQDGNAFHKLYWKANKSFSGGGMVVKFQNKDSLIWRFSKSGILPWGAKVSPLLCTLDFQFQCVYISLLRMRQERREKVYVYV